MTTADSVRGTFSPPFLPLYHIYEMNARKYKVGSWIFFELRIESVRKTKTSYVACTNLLYNYDSVYSAFIKCAFFVRHFAVFLCRKGTAILLRPF